MQHGLGSRFITQISAPLILVAAWATAGSLQASIFLPADMPIDIEQMLAASKKTSLTASSAALPSNRADRKSEHLPLSPQHDSKQPVQLLFMPCLPSTGGSNSGTFNFTPSSSSGTNGTCTFLFDLAAPFSLYDLELVVWVCGERRFSLPTPLDNDLLRPPQAG